jgi:hypothetical protein
MNECTITEIYNINAILTSASFTAHGFTSRLDVVPIKPKLQIPELFHAPSNI